MTKAKNMDAVHRRTPKYADHFANTKVRKRMISVRLIEDRFRCDMCFRKPHYEIIADDRYNELPAFQLHLCKAHAAQLAKHIFDAFLLEAEKEGADG